MQHYLKKLPVFLYICLALLAYSCTYEKEFVNDKNRGDVKFEQKSLSELLNNPIFNEAYRKVVKSEIVLSNEIMARTAFENQYNFTITDGVPVKIVEIDGFTSYSMLIKSDGEEKNGFENLVIRVDSLNKTVATILYYKTTITEFEDATPEIYQNIEKQVTPLIEDDEEVLPEDIEKITTQHCLTYYFPMCEILGGNYTNSHVANSSECVTSFFTSQVVCFTTTVFGGINESNSGSTVSSTSSSSSSGGGANGTGLSNLDLIPTIPVPPCEHCSDVNEINTPCARLKKLFNPAKANIKPLITQLQSTLGQAVENGFALTKLANENYTNSNQPLTAGSSNTITTFAGPGYYGSIHTHPFPGILPMFSFQDIYSLLQIHQHCVTEDELEVVIILVCKNSAGANQTYALKIDDPTALFNAISAEMAQIPNYATYTPEKLAELVDTGIIGPLFLQPQNVNKEVAFLNTFSGYGVSLYKTDNDLTKWNKLEADNTSIIQPIIKSTPCK